MGRPITIILTTGLAVGLASAAGCQAPRGPVSIDSHDTDLEVLAMKRDVRAHDEVDEPKMVADLDDFDPAVRFYAIQSLRRLTGDDFGYKFYLDDPAERAPAVARWRAWVAAHPVGP